ncbi:MAG: alpha/beta fold hydrolase [Blastocatellia bacterium]|nr:alpha/beta fold hydrolase [Blastocatellia bacterium]
MARQHEMLELKMPDGQMVRGGYSAPRGGGPVPAVVFAHGFGSARGGEKAGALEAACARRGWAFAACDFRGHGESDGTMRELRGSRLLEDLDAIARTVADRAGGPLFLFGSSLGGWTSAWLSANEPTRITACALVAPALRFFEFLRLSPEGMAEWRGAGRMRVHNEFVDVEIDYDLTAEADRFAFNSLAARFETPAILFHGMQDDLVPHSISIDFIEQAPFHELELVLFKTGDHRLLDRKDEMASRACAFFAAQMAGGDGIH